MRLCIFTCIYVTLFFICNNEAHRYDFWESPMRISEVLEFSNISMSKEERLSHVRLVTEMFDFAYQGYLNHAFPYDELNPINCSGRGYDHDVPSNINVNDALGDYQLGLVDSLDTLAIMGKANDFKYAVGLIIEKLTFEQNTKVQVFEATIRILGGLLSAHFLINDKHQHFGALRPHDYNDELLSLAHDIANRMLDSFTNTPTGLPHPRFHLNSGLKDETTTENCLAGAGSLLIEFGSLSALLNDPVYASTARQVVLKLWKMRSRASGLFGSTMDVRTGEWKNRMSGLGAGQDSFYEYLLKSYILFGDVELGNMFEEILESLRFHLRNSHTDCLAATGPPPIYWNVDMYTGQRVNNWIDTLQSFWPGVLILHGDVAEAICQHAIHYFIWQIYDFPPERYNILTEKAELLFYPLRPEFVESTYFLYRATKHPFYLQVGKKIINNLNKYARAKCGFATIHNVIDKSQEDRMESFFLSETLKYLYLLFDESNPVNQHQTDYIFSTQAHLFPIKRIRDLLKQFPYNPFHTERKTNMINKTCSNLKLNPVKRPLDETSWNELAQFVNTKLRS